MNVSRTKRAMTNIASSIALQVVNMLVGFFIPQLVLEQYGSEYYGLISSTQQILAYFVIFEAGIGAASIQELYKSLAVEDYNRTNAILVTTNRFYNRAALLYSIGLLVVAVIYPLIVKGQISTCKVIMLVLVMGVSGVIEFLVQGKYRVLLTADQKLSTLNRFIAFSQLGGLLVRVVLILLKVDIVVVQTSFTLVVLIRALLSGVYVRKHYKYVNFRNSQMVEPVKQRSAVMIQQLAGLAVYNSPTLLLTLFTNLKTVSLYSVYNFVFSSLYSILTLTFSVAVTASFGNLASNKDSEALRYNYNIFEFGYYLLFTTIYAVTAVMIIPFVRLYTKGVVDIQYVNYTIAFLFILIGLLNNIRVPMIMMINAMGHFEQTKYRALAEAIINVSVSFVLVFCIGIYGVLVGTIASFLYRTLDMIIYTNKYILGQTLFVTIKRIVVNIISAALICSVVFNFVNNTGVPINSWWGWVTLAIMITMVIGIGMLVINFLLERSTFRAVINKLMIIKRVRGGANSAQ